MVFFLKLKTTRATLGRSGGALLGLLSLGLHGLVLSLPMPEPATPALGPQADQPDPIDAIAVVRLPLAPPPAAELSPTDAPGPAIAPPAVANRPAQPVASFPDPSITKPALPETSILPEPVPSAPPAVSLDAPPAPSEATLEERLRDPAQYAFNQQAKSLVANEFSLHTAVVPDWLEAEGQGLSNDEVPVMGTKQAPLQVAYPINSCLVPPPAEGLVGVIVTPAGQLAKAPILLDSTGYDVLDDKALELAREHTFATLPEGSNDPTNPRAHWLPVQVQYDSASCTP